jgi:LysM repeat protein
MSLFSVPWRVLLVALLVLGASGCNPLTDGPTDEEKDPHYLAGKNRLSGMDYDGAIAAFENALISNPKSAAAHFELGVLYEEKKNDYAAAIYHFDRHLQVRPESNMAETVKQHVLACKLELAKTVPFALVNRQVQDELRRLYAGSATLHDQVELLKAQLVEQSNACSNRLAQITQAAALTQLQAQAQSLPPASPPAESERHSGPTDRLTTPPASHSSPRPASPKSHVVKPGETLASLARRYNVKLSALQNANPSVDARRLKAGQILNLPAGARN